MVGRLGTHPACAERLRWRLVPDGSGPCVLRHHVPVRRRRHRRGSPPPSGHSARTSGRQGRGWPAVRGTRPGRATGGVQRAVDRHRGWLAGAAGVRRADERVCQTLGWCASS